VTDVVPDISIDRATPDDYAGVLALNDGAVPAVNSIPIDKLARLHRQSVFFGVARDPVGIAGFLLALDQQADYDSLNFRYFVRNYPRFAYIDRVVVRPDLHGTGTGKRLYHGLLAAVAESAPLLACEVNLEPPNPGSLLFHRRMGFEPVGEQLTEGGRKRVCLMIRPISGHAA
jgi:predicted GNAT superfamily acetyltransferase